MDTANPVSTLGSADGPFPRPRSPTLAGPRAHSAFDNWRGASVGDLVVTAKTSQETPGHEYFMISLLTCVRLSGNIHKNSSSMSLNALRYVSRHTELAQAREEWANRWPADRMDGSRYEACNGLAKGCRGRHPWI